MTCLPQAEFIPKCDQKLTALGRDLGGGNFREETPVAAKHKELGSLVLSLCSEISLSGQGLQIQDWGFPNDAGADGGSKEHSCFSVKSYCTP